MNKSDKRQEWLKEKFLNNAYVKDAQKGYVAVSDFNLAINTEILQVASQCWAEHYQPLKQIDAIVGLPDAGSRLVSVLADLLKIDTILPSKRTSVVPGAWQDVISYTNESFTSNREEVLSHIGFIKPGMRILVIDDVVARGATALAAIKALQAAEAEVVGLAVLFDKKWQGGIKKIQGETGVSPFSLISINNISKEGEIVL